MKKKLVVMLMVVGIGAVLSGCNKQAFDTTQHFDRAILALPNGEIVEGKVQSWLDFDDGDQIQVKIDGKRYLIHSEDVVLISE